jgi:hypothetical protein
MASVTRGFLGQAKEESIAVQVTGACKQLSRCVTATSACIGVAVAVPGALSALLRLVRCCNRSKPHTSLLVGALAALRPLARDAQGAAQTLNPGTLRNPLFAVSPCYLSMCWPRGGIWSAGEVSSPGSPTDFTCGFQLHALDSMLAWRLADWLIGCACRRCSAHVGGRNGCAG